KVESPIVASHDVTWRILKVARLNQREADLPADRVGCRVVHGGKGVEEAARLFRPSHGDRLRGSRGRDAAPLEGREHRPAHLVDLLVPPGARPVADRAKALTVGVGDDLEDPAATSVGGSLEPAMALRDLV